MIDTLHLSQNLIEQSSRCSNWATIESKDGVGFVGGLITKGLIREKWLGLITKGLIWEKWLLLYIGISRIGSGRGSILLNNLVHILLIIVYINFLTGFH